MVVMLKEDYKEIYNVKLNIINTISNLEEKERVTNLLEMLEQKTREDFIKWLEYIKQIQMSEKLHKKIELKLEELKDER